jgi:hypothetical protein
MPAPPKRMLNKTEAAEYSGLGSVFEAVCPVRPIAFSKRRRLWDVKRLDEWLDTLATNGQVTAKTKAQRFAEI